MDFNKLKAQLKEEFIGIDPQIDQIVDLVKPWYNNPDLYDQPCIVNLWGMTGHGKTSLVNRMIDLMGEGHNRMYMNCHSMIDMNLYFMDGFIDDNNTDRTTTNKFLIFDDFQYVRTIDEEGREKSSSALSIMWNLMDTGVVSEPFYASYFKIMKKILHVVNAFEKPDDIVNGRIIDVIKYIPEKYLRTAANSIFNATYGIHKKKKKDLAEIDTCDDFFLNADTVGIVGYICRMLGYTECETDADFVTERLNWDAFQWRDFFNEVFEKMKLGNNHDFHNSIIFVIGNLDEAFYGTAKEVNPEMSADQLNEITSKVNIVDIKKGLQKRFRNEQIARLGNTHIIYPSLNADSYRKIIRRYVDKYVHRMHSLTGADIIIEQSLLDCLYDEGVFPTQGVRPLFSTINDIIKPSIPKAIDEFASNGVDGFVSLRCRFNKDSKSLIITAISLNSDPCEVVIPIVLRVRDAYKDNSETIANTSVHESGHFILYKYLTGNSPVKVISRSLEQSCLGYMMEKFDEGVSSKKRLHDEIVVCLGGYVAEQLVFGSDYQSSGASSDIENATSIAVSLYNEWGLETHPIKMTISNDPENENTVNLTEDDRASLNEGVVKMMDDAKEKAIMLLTRNKVLHDCFIESFTRLNAQGELTEDDIKEISDKIETAEGYSPMPKGFYKEAISSFK